MFRHPIPARDAPGYINAADLCLATLQNAPLFRGAIPSKFSEYMACGKAVVVGFWGEAETIVEKAGAGMVFIPAMMRRSPGVLRRSLTRPSGAPRWEERLRGGARAFLAGSRAKRHFARSW